jgi:hypothetical protein
MFLGSLARRTIDLWFKHRHVIAHPLSGVGKHSPELTTTEYPQPFSRLDAMLDGDIERW